ncbi:von Willebrand factor type A domain-containing protein [uncultured Chitinophaga sp.]|uniref:vWA domain-containing protein n=1 Tax=uncultured Chitinophaga sp. TaxID=339340 RepID=UPI0025E450CF|nr:von Willebrand factor type A domain-containing protein [uncultured Chitinophaga sp.]
MRKLLILLGVIMALSLRLMAQQGSWISGVVQDSISHNPVNNVVITVMKDTGKAICNRYGLFRVAVPKNAEYLLFEHPKYYPKQIKIEQFDRMMVELSPREKAVDAIGLAKARARSARNSNPNYGNTAIGMSSFFDETYGQLYENKFLDAGIQGSSTIAIDVDRAAYSNMRRFIRTKEPMPVDVVRIEELVNYFHYDYPCPGKDSIFGIYAAYADCPWKKKHNLLQIAIRAQQGNLDSLPPSNLVFLIDVSGSMGNPNKLPLLQAAFRVLTNNLRDKDKVAIVAYAGTPGVILSSTPGSQKGKILTAIDNLSAGGATAGEAAIKMAYQIAEENFVKDGNNRVILATDGDFNVGQTSDRDMEDLITQKKESGVLLTCLGFGMKDYKDSKLETLSSKGNGNFAYIDDLEEANKVFAREFGSTLFTVAKDVRAQVCFNPARVKSYRLLGYENKSLKDDEDSTGKIVGGIVGAGHCVVAMYEIVPADNPNTDDSLLSNVKIWYRTPLDSTERFLQQNITSPLTNFITASNDFRFASAVTLFGMLVRKSAYKGEGDVKMVLDIAKKSLGKDEGKYREEFLKLVKTVWKKTDWLVEKQEDRNKTKKKR